MPKSADEVREAARNICIQSGLEIFLRAVVDHGEGYYVTVLVSRDAWQNPVLKETASQIEKLPGVVGVGVEFGAP